MSLCVPEVSLNTPHLPLFLPRSTAMMSDATQSENPPSPPAVASEVASEVGTEEGEMEWPEELSDPTPDQCDRVHFTCKLNKKMGYGTRPG
jgi:hypothetical protein